MALTIPGDRDLEAAMTTRFVSLDEEGYFVLDGLRVSDQELGKLWLSQMRMDDRGRATFVDSSPGGPFRVIVESFDQPLVALDIVVPENRDAHLWKARFPYEVEKDFDPDTLRFDEWDRFYIRTIDGLPAVLNRSAQSRLFQQADKYDDASITFGSLTVSIAPFFDETIEAEEPGWWDNLYQTGDTRWDGGAAHPLLDELIPPLKMTRSRVLVLGCGQGHDAAWWAKRGHIVTAVDFSPEAIERARAKYGESSDLKWVCADAFDLSAAWNSTFDIIFEHTMFCAVPPSLREDLCRTWWRLLSERGRLMGFVPIMDKPLGPPYGSSEWEIRRRLLEPPRAGSSKRALFRPLIWKRVKNSVEKRVGQELFFVVERGDSVQ